MLLSAASGRITPPLARALPKLKRIRSRGSIGFVSLPPVRLGRSLSALGRSRQRRGLVSNIRLGSQYVQMGTWAILEVVLKSTPFASICTDGDLGYFRGGFSKYTI